MKINIGSDELILWLRKNGKAEGVINDKIGNDISNLIQQQLGGTIIVYDQPSYWQTDGVAKNVADDNLPKTAAQYSLDTSVLKELFETLSKW